MVINVLTSFPLQKLQNPNVNSRARPQQVKKNTLIRKTAKKRRDTKSSSLLHFDNSFLFFCKINQSLPPCHSLKHWTCESLTALPSSLGHSSRSDILLSGSLISGVRNTYIYPFTTTFCLPWGDHFWYNRSEDSCSVLQIFSQKIVSCSQTLQK